MYTTEEGGGGEAEAEEFGGVSKFFEGKSGDGKNFWRQGAGDANWFLNAIERSSIFWKPLHKWSSLFFSSMKLGCFYY